MSTVTRGLAALSATVCSVDGTGAFLSSSQLVQSTEDTQSCDSACMHGDALHSCRSRALWLYGTTTKGNLTLALNQLHTDCQGQCSCSSDDFPQLLQSDCSSPCTVGKEDYSCRARVLWELNHSSLVSLPDAFGIVNDQCAGQCSCKGEEFPILPERPEEEACKTSTQGEWCYDAVQWAMTHGIHHNPSWYHGLTVDSSFKEFQRFLHKRGIGRCRNPCDCDAACVQNGEPHSCRSRALWVYGTDAAGNLTEALSLTNEDCEGQCSCSSAEFPDLLQSECNSMCSVGSENHTCRSRTLWELNLTSDVSLPEAVGIVNTQCAGQCSCKGEEFPIVPEQPAAKPCQNTTSGEACYDAVLWAMNHGIKLYPSWYKGLTSDASFEKFQTFLYKRGLGLCRRPCQK